MILHDAVMVVVNAIREEAVVEVATLSMMGAILRAELKKVIRNFRNRT